MSEQHEEASEFSLGDITGTLQRRKWVIIQAFVFVTIIGAVTASLSPNQFDARASLLVDTPQQMVVMAQVGGNNSSPLSPLLYLRQRRTMETQLAILNSNEFAKRLFKRLGTGESVVPASLAYTTQPETNIIRIASTSTEGKAAAAWANAAAEEYVALTSEANKGAITQTRNYLQRMTTESEKRLTKAENALLSFKKRTKSIGTPESALEDQKRGADLQAQYFQAQNDLRAIDSEIVARRDRLLKEPLMVKEVRIQANVEYDAIVSAIAKLKAERALAMGDFKEDSATILNFNERIAGLEEAKQSKSPFIKEPVDKENPAIEQLRTELRGFELKRGTQAQLVDQLSKVAVKSTERIDLLPAWKVEGDSLQRARDQAEKAYVEYSDKLRQLDIDSSQIEAGAQVMESAPVPGVPTGPNRGQQVGLAMMLGLLLGVGFAFLQEFLDDRVNTSEDIERVASLATLGIVPTIPDENNRLLIGQDAFSPITESYRALRTAVQYSYVDHKVNALAVTSAHPGEGKSVTSANLAIAMALQGKRVILVDADLRRPSVHRMFRVEAEPGLTSVLADEISLEDALHSTAIEGFKVLTAGPLPPNPPELLNSQAMMDLLERFKEHADLVVFDTPPTIPVTDSQVLASHVDGVVLVVEAGQSRKATLKHARDLLERTHGRLLGVVLNKIDQSAKGYYYHYYYRGGYRKYKKYGYGNKRYGYGGGYGQYGGQQGYGQYGYGQYGYGQQGYGYGGNYGYGGARHKLGVSPDDQEPMPAGVQVPMAEPEQEKPRLPERLRDWE